MNLHIQKRDKKKGDEVKKYIETLTKPPGSLGRLEELAVSLAEMTGQSFPIITPPGIIIFAADHGIVAEGVSAFPQEVTAQMVYNFLNEGAAINVFSKQIDAIFKIIDIGVNKQIEHQKLIKRKIRPGTRNFLQEDAMTKEEVNHALQIGFAEAKKMIRNGIRCIIPGEMGIGNTTAASAIVAVLSGKSVNRLVGRGTGISTEKLQHKESIIKKALKRRQPDPTDPYDILAKVGGFEIAGMAGAILAGAAHRIPILLDGFICTAAALIATKINKNVGDYIIIGHQSAEPGHDIAVHLLGKKPILDLEMRLGEGTGAAVAFPILLSAIKMLEMETFSSAHIKITCYVVS